MGAESATLVAVLAAGADKKAVLAAVARAGGEARGEKRRAGARRGMGRPIQPWHCPTERGNVETGGGPAERPATPAAPEPLRFFNGYGGFTADGSEYVIRLEPGGAGPRRPPLPWINVVANEALRLPRHRERRGLHVERGTAASTA